VLPRQAHGGEFANLIVQPHMYDVEWYSFVTSIWYQSGAGIFMCLFVV